MYATRLVSTFALAALLAPAIPATAPPALSVRYAGFAADPTDTSLPLAFDVDASAAATVDPTLYVNWTRPDATGDAFVQPSATAALAQGTTRLDVTLDTSRGGGTYVLDLVLRQGDLTLGALRETTVIAPEPSSHASAPLGAPDYPTTLAFTNDAVNAAGKTKTPGDALITRVHVADGNGLRDVASLVFRYDRILPNGTRRPVDARTYTTLDGGNASLAAKDVEDDFADSPLKDGAYVENVTATPRLGPSVSLERAFTIAKVKPTLATAAVIDPAEATPDAPLTFHLSFAVADKNLGTGPLDPNGVSALDSLQLRLFRGSTAVNDVAWGLGLGDASGHAPSLVLDVTTVTHTDGRFPYATAQGAGVFTIGAEIRSPVGAAAGTYRASLYHVSPGATAALLGSTTFVLDDLPTVASLTLDNATVHPQGTLRATFATSGHIDHVEARLLRGATVVTQGRAAAGSTTVTLRIPRDFTPGNYTFELLAAGSPNGSTVLDTTGTPLNARRLAVHLVADIPPILARVDGATPLRAGRLAMHASLRLAENAALGDVDFTIDGAPAAGRLDRGSNDSFDLDASTLSPGRHHVVATAAGEALDVPLDVGATVGAALTSAEGPALPGKAVARLTSTGTLPLERLLLLTDDRGASGKVEVLVGGISRGNASATAGRAVLELSPPLGADELAELVFCPDVHDGTASADTVGFRIYALAGALSP